MTPAEERDLLGIIGAEFRAFRGNVERRLTAMEEQHQAMTEKLDEALRIARQNADWVGNKERNITDFLAGQGTKDVAAAARDVALTKEVAELSAKLDLLAEKHKHELGKAMLIAAGTVIAGIAGAVALWLRSAGAWAFVAARSLLEMGR